MRYQPLSSQFYAQNRAQLIETLHQGGLAIVTSHDEYPRSGDTTFPFRQNAELLYLTGIDQEETILTLSPWHPNPDYREILFIKNPSPEMVIWYGHRLSKEQATELSGVTTVFFTEQFEAVLHDLMVNAQEVYMHLPENPRMKVTHPTQEIRLAKKLKEEYPLHTFQRLAPAMLDLRLVKRKEEFEAIVKACKITENAFLRAIKAVKPGKYEYEIEAELIYEMTKSGASGHSFAPIIAAGADTCILHYVKNDKKMEDGDLLLMDFGAEYANYAGDCTRTIPVNGKYTPRQKEVYEAVLKIYKETIPLFKPGMTINKVNQFVFKRTNEELIKLGLYTQEEADNQDPAAPLFKRYFMHNISHFMGLDVHDIGNRDITFEQGMVLSCEPGIYIAEENIGVRIETDVVVADRPVDLMKNLPVEVEEIEQLMASSH